MTRRSTTLLASATALLLGAAAVAGCGGEGGKAGESSAAPKTANERSATIGVATERLGNVLVDARGHTLYLFERDSGTTSTCTGACAIDWPPLRATGKPRVRGANQSLLATGARVDGTTQVSYNGHPVYLFSGDEKPGDTNGQGVDAFGGLWYALSPAGDPVTTQAPSNGLGY